MTMPVPAPDPAQANTPVGEAAPDLVRRAALGRVALALGLAGVVLAGALAWGLVAYLEADVRWAAPLAAALGAAMVALPMASLVYHLAARRPEPIETVPSLKTAAPRALFIELAERELARARRYGSGAALLLVEVDRHAHLVQSRGALTADALLEEMLRQTAPTLRGADLLTRFAPAQMAVFLAPADATGALDVAERIRERAEALDVRVVSAATRTAASASQSQPLRVTVSVGVAHLRPAHLNLQAVIDDAEEANAAARLAGGNCVRAAPAPAGPLGLPGQAAQGTRKPHG